MGWGEGKLPLHPFSLTNLHKGRRMTTSSNPPSLATEVFASAVSTPPNRLFDGRGELWEDWLEGFIKLGWIRQRLPAGDFWFTTSDKRVVGIEVKSVADYLGRIGDARREFATLLDVVDIPMFLVFGAWARSSNDFLVINSRKGISWGMTWNLLLSFQLSGMIVEPALSRNHAFTRINQLFTYFQKPEHMATLVPRRCGSDRRVAALMPIPGVSEKLGKGLINHFGSLKAIANAQVEELQEVPLIGGKKAQVIYGYFNQTTPVG